MDRLISYITEKGFETEQVDNKFIRINGHLFSSTQKWINARRNEGNLDQIIDITLDHIAKSGKKEAGLYEDYEDIFKEFGTSKNL